MPDEYPLAKWDAGLINDLKEIPNVTFEISEKIATPTHSLSLVEAIQINYFFKVSDIDVYSAKLIFWNADVDEINLDNYIYEVEMTVDSKGRYTAQSEFIYSTAMGETVFAAACITDVEGNVYYSAIDAYSPESYAETAINKSSDPTMVELAKRMVIYGANAIELFNN